MKDMKKWLGVVVLITGFLLINTSVFAVHKGAGDLTCGNCHTMHNSQGGGTNTLGGASGGSLVLLRADISSRENIHRLCLQCHSDQGVNGDVQFAPKNVKPPKVHLATGTLWTQTDHLTGIGAGGNFYPEVSADFTLSSDGGSTALGKGHSIGLANVIPPGSADSTQIAGFSCTSCHDPHGTANAADTAINKFRNLRMSATNAGSNAGVELTDADHTSWVGGINGTNFQDTILAIGGASNKNNIWPVIKTASTTGSAADDTANSNSYGGGSNGISRWCAQCHDNWHEAIVTTNASGDDWKRHPVNNTLAGDGSTTSGAGVTIIDTTNYDVTTAGYYLPVASASSSNRVFYKTNNSTDRVMCLSCHFAHGGPYNDNLRWDYTSAVGTGSQTGNAVSSTKGCQLCHNR